MQGTVTDTSGAVIANATVTAINNASGVSSARSSTSAGFFSIAPLPAGAYTVTVTANGFQKLVQDNLIVDSLQTRTFSPVMKVGRANQTVTVTAAPPLLNTADATMGMTIENYQQQLRRRRLYPHPVPGAQKRRATNNVIPSSYLSPIAQKMEAFLPAPSNPGAIIIHYLGGVRICHQRIRTQPRPGRLHSRPGQGS
ncbi:MAG TPA: carboxypeptidase-like regulatory domain-containing protein [Acidobacteriaceae bacterium]|nr:carboxypeptidase-like regulatory domain-containing protein [Acidobacteriaceae bacterium]